jgi:hypothetical protein
MLEMNPNAGDQKLRDLGVDAEVGHRLIEVKIGVSGLRSVRLGLIQMAYALAERPKSKGYLVLSQVAITRGRLLEEWKFAAAVLRRETLERMFLCMEEGGRFDGIPDTPDPETQRVLLQVLERERAQAAPRIARADASFVVLEILLHQWLTSGQFLTADWLARTSGYTYPTVANVLRSLGSLIERGSDRRFRLRWFPREELARLVSMSGRARATARYADRSGQPRSPEAHLARLEKLNLPGLAIGGVLGAKHYFPDLDIVGTPRLDISLHARDHSVDLDFIEKLDPALQRVMDPLEPASVAVHNVYHAKSLFVPREGGMQWADPVECLLDLHEARLEMQAAQFLDALSKQRPLSS